MTSKVHVDLADAFPQLHEGRVKIDIYAARDSIEKRIVLQHAGNVEQHIGGAGFFPERFITEADGLFGASEEKRGAVAQTKLLHRCAEVACVLGVWERTARCPQRFDLDRFNENHIVPEFSKSEEILQDGPGGAALKGVRGDHAGEQNAQSRIHAGAYCTISRTIAVN